MQKNLYSKSLKLALMFALVLQASTNVFAMDPNDFFDMDHYETTNDGFPMYPDYNYTQKFDLEVDPNDPNSNLPSANSTDLPTTTSTMSLQQTQPTNVTENGSVKVNCKEQCNRKRPYNITRFLKAHANDGLTELHKVIISNNGRNITAVKKTINEKPTLIDVEDKDKWTPLYYVSAAYTNTKYKNPPKITNQRYNGKVYYIKNAFTIMKMLLDAGANPDVKDNDGKNPLFYATTQERKALLSKAMEKRKLLDVVYSVEEKRPEDGKNVTSNEYFPDPDALSCYTTAKFDFGASSDDNLNDLNFNLQTENQTELTMPLQPASTAANQPLVEATSITNVDEGDTLILDELLCLDNLNPVNNPEIVVNNVDDTQETTAATKPSQQAMDTEDTRKIGSKRKLDEYLNPELLKKPKIAVNNVTEDKQTIGSKQESKAVDYSIEVDDLRDPEKKRLRPEDDEGVTSNKSFPIGIDENVLNYLARTALHRAVKNELFEEIIFQLRAGVDVNACDDLGGTPLHYAAENGNILIINQLLISGAKVNTTDKFNNTALNIAIQNGKTEAVKLLLANKANVRATDPFGHVPLLLAIYHEKRGAAIITQMLVDHYNENKIKIPKDLIPKLIKLGVMGVTGF